jgi:hypothetical protein
MDRQEFINRWQTVIEDPFFLIFNNANSIPGGMQIRDKSNPYTDKVKQTAYPIILIFGSIFFLSFLWPTLSDTGKLIFIAFLLFVLVQYVRSLRRSSDFTFNRKGIYLHSWSKKLIPTLERQAFVPWDRIHEILIFRTEEWIVFSFTLNLPSDVTFNSCSYTEFDRMMSSLQSECQSAFIKLDKQIAPDEFVHRLEFRLGFASIPLWPYFGGGLRIIFGLDHFWQRRDFLSIKADVQRYKRILEEIPSTDTPLHDNSEFR